MVPKASIHTPHHTASTAILSISLWDAPDLIVELPNVKLMTPISKRFWDKKFEKSKIAAATIPLDAEWPN